MEVLFIIFCICSVFNISMSIYDFIYNTKVLTVSDIGLFVLFCLIFTPVGTIMILIHLYQNYKDKVVIDIRKK
jgi:hypothetical protein